MKRGKLRTCACGDSEASHICAECQDKRLCDNCFKLSACECRGEASGSEACAIDNHGLADDKSPSGTCWRGVSSFSELSLLLRTDAEYNDKQVTRASAAKGKKKRLSDSPDMIPIYEAG
jgi:hypothetical protein